jgi:hypothetical protein
MGCNVVPEKMFTRQRRDRGDEPQFDALLIAHQLPNVIKILGTGDGSDGQLVKISHLID